MAVADAATGVLHVKGTHFEAPAETCLFCFVFKHVQIPSEYTRADEHRFLIFTVMALLNNVWHSQKTFAVLEDYFF